MLWHCLLVKNNYPVFVSNYTLRKKRGCSEVGSRVLLRHAASPPLLFKNLGATRVTYTSSLVASAPLCYALAFRSGIHFFRSSLQQQQLPVHLVSFLFTNFASMMILRIIFSCSALSACHFLCYVMSAYVSNRAHTSNHRHMPYASTCLLNQANAHITIIHVLTLLFFLLLLLYAVGLLPTFNPPTSTSSGGLDLLAAAAALATATLVVPPLSAAPTALPTLPVPLMTASVNPVPAPTNPVPASLPLPPIQLGASSVSDKIRRRIINLEFVEMYELLPEAWTAEQSQSEGCCRQARRPTRRAPITNILVWMEYYSSLVSILGSAYPSVIGELMAYQQTIIIVCRNFEESAWVVYDRIYHHRAAAQRSLSWLMVDSALYQQTFTGRAIRIQRCTNCFSEHHTSADCLASFPDSPPLTF